MRWSLPRSGPQTCRSWRQPSSGGPTRRRSSRTARRSAWPVPPTGAGQMAAWISSTALIAFLTAGKFRHSAGQGAPLRANPQDKGRSCSRNNPDMDLMPGGTARCATPPGETPPIRAGANRPAPGRFGRGSRDIPSIVRASHDRGALVPTAHRGRSVPSPRGVLAPATFRQSTSGNHAETGFLGRRLASGFRLSNASATVR